MLSGQQIQPKLCIIATIPEVVHSFLHGHITAASEHWRVTVVCHPLHAEMLSDLNVEIIPLRFERKASPLHDLRSLFDLISLFRLEQFDLVHSIMPKTGLLSMLAARITGVPVRVHTFTGQVWANKRGLMRLMLKMIDKAIVRLSSHIIVDSPTQRDFLKAEGVLHKHQGQVLGCGSICGVDTQRFKPDIEMRQSVRKKLYIDEEQFVLLFVGRMNEDKGIPDLVRVFVELAGEGRNLVLMLVGAEENIKFYQIRNWCGTYQNRLRTLGFTKNPEQYMAAADVFCLPSQREGFGQVIIEAAACGVPTIATAIYGIRDAVVDNLTGKLFEPGDMGTLKQSIISMMDDARLRALMGEAARIRAQQQFSAQTITQEMMNFYQSVLRAT